MGTADTERRQMERQHVFVINTAPEVLDLIRELLQDERYNVTTTNFVPQTFDQIAALHPSLLIIDLAVGERAGWDLLDELRGDAQTNGIPVIVVSTNQRLLDRAREEQVRSGSRHFVVKPFDIAELLEATESLIGPA